jgi:hypothetical protein
MSPRTYSSPNAMLGKFLANAGILPALIIS